MSAFRGRQRRELLLAAADLFNQARRLHADAAYVQVNGYHEINVLLREAEVAMRLYELSKPAAWDES